MASGDRAATPGRPHDAGDDAQLRADLVLEHIDRLPTLSPVATRVLSISSAEDADLDEIVRLLESDPSLAAMMLGLCRRADKGLGDRVATVRHAVTMLGLEAVRSAVLSVHVYDVLQPPGAREEARTGHSVDRAGLWKHALGVACASELIARANPRHGIRPDSAFCCGLLHDLGRIALDVVLPKAMAGVVEVCEQRGCDAAPIERTIFGLDHHAAGRRLAERWGLPSVVRDVIWMHSQPLAALPEGVDRAAVGVVTLGRLWARQMHLGWSGDFGRCADPAHAAREIGIDPKIFDSSSRRLIEEFAARCSLLGLDSRSEPELLVDAIMRANRSLAKLNQSLEARAERAGRHAGVLDAIARYHAEEDARDGVVGAISRVVRSARTIFGDGYYAALVQDRPGGPMLWVRVEPSGRVTQTATINPPDGASLDAEQFGPSASGVPALALLPWLTERVKAEIDARRVRVWPVLTCSSGERPGVVLLHDRGHMRHDATSWAALLSAWASGVLGAWRHERSGRLGDDLAAANRALAEAQQEFAERESMVRLGEMTAGAAHEMNNPLAVIRGRSQMLAARLEDTRHRESAEAIAQAAASLSEMIRSLHLLASPGEPEFRACTAAELIHRATEIGGERLGTQPRVSVRIGDDLPCASADLELVAQAMAEGIVNAHQAMEGATNGGIVRIGVQHTPGGGRLEFRIEDEGPGLSERALRHAFDPFFSERSAGRRPGLGLARARRLVEVCGGRVWIDNAQGGGAVFTLSIDEHVDGLRGRAA